MLYKVQVSNYLPSHTQCLMASQAHFFQARKIAHLLLGNNDCVVPRDSDYVILSNNDYTVASDSHCATLAHSHYAILAHSHCAIAVHSDYVIDSGSVRASFIDGDCALFVDSEGVLLQVKIVAPPSGNQLTLDS